MYVGMYGVSFSRNIFDKKKSNYSGSLSMKKKGTKRASSSLASQQQARYTSFADFQTFSTTVVEPVVSPVYTGHNHDLQILSKSLLSKKDLVTRLKLLQDLEDLVPCLPPKDVRDFLLNWAFLFRRMLQDNDIRVRILSARVMHALNKAIPKACTNRMHVLAWPLMVLSHDPVQEVREHEVSLLQVSPALWESVMMPEIQRALAMKLSQMPKALEPEEAATRHERMHVVGLRLLLSLPSSQCTSFLLEYPSTWTFLKSKSRALRYAAYQLLKQAFQEEMLSKELINLLSRLPSETERENTSSMLEALLALLSSPSRWDSCIHLRKVFLPELFKLLGERMMNMSGQAGLDCIMPLMSLSPKDPTMRFLWMQALMKGIHTCEEFILDNNVSKQDYAYTTFYQYHTCFFECCLLVQDPKLYTSILEYIQQPQHSVEYLSKVISSISLKAWPEDYSFPFELGSSSLRLLSALLRIDVVKPLAFAQQLMMESLVDKDPVLLPLVVDILETLKRGQVDVSVYRSPFQVWFSKDTVFSEAVCRLARVLFDEVAQQRERLPSFTDAQLVEWLKWTGDTGLKDIVMTNLWDMPGLALVCVGGVP